MAKSAVAALPAALHVGQQPKTRRSLGTSQSFTYLSMRSYITAGFNHNAMDTMHVP